MGTRQWKFYNEPDPLPLGRMASGGYDTGLVRSVCANYAETRRNVLNLMYNFDVDQIVLPGPGSVEEWFSLPSMIVGGRIIRPGKLRIYIRTQSASELAANKIHCEASIGPDTVESTVGIQNITLGWRLLTLELSAGACVPRERLKIRMKTIGTNTIAIHGICCYQPGNGDVSLLVDLDDANCVLGDADYPNSMRVMELLRQNTIAVRGYKTPKANVWCQWFRDWHKQAAGAGANNNDLGDYRFVKRAGVSEVKCHFIAYEDSGANCTIRMEITDPDAELAAGILPAANQTQVVVGGPFWYTLTWTFQGADITNERNLGFIIDGWDSTAPYTANVYVPGIYLVETAPSAAIAHTVPDATNVPFNSDIEATIEHDNMRTTLNHLWFQGGKQYLIGDWRFAEIPAAVYVMDFLCQRAGWAKQFFGNPAVYNNSTVARAILFSSTSSVRLRSRLEYSTDATASATKQMQTALDDTFGGGIANYYEADPRYDLATNNLHAFTDVIDGDMLRKIEECELNIRAADWEEHYDGVNEPPQIYVSAIGNTTGYVIPHQYSIEEIELHPTEFP